MGTYTPTRTRPTTQLSALHPLGSGARPVEMSLDPIEALCRWPRATPLAAIWGDAAENPTGNTTKRPWSRWIILAQPTGEAVPVTEAFADRPWCGSEGRSVPEGEPPFAGGWIGFLGYELGRRIEPAAGGPGREGVERAGESGAGDGVMLRCESGWAFDTWDRRWWRFGAGPELGGPGTGRLAGRAGAAGAGRAGRAGRAGQAGFMPAPFVLGAMRSTMGRGAYCERVARIVEYIRAGDIFQANLTHPLTGSFRGSARGLFARWASLVRPQHGAYVEVPSPHGPRAIVSMSPELFLDYDPAAQRVVTRPMKGTSSARLDPALLETSTKDRAELNMIVDLMRNDLGRVCALGSVRVDQQRVIEQHGGGQTKGAGGVHQGVATISGQLREGLGVGDLLRATFAPGSVTGAPKIRAMQIIEELEPTQRGAYCGSIGFISDAGHARFNVAIRTAVIDENDECDGGDGGSGCSGEPPGHTFANATLTYNVGAGIVADSAPDKEWAETMTKAEILASVASSISRT